MTASWQILQGDALSVLRGMANESIHCVVTSPPYWGLRSYDTEPLVWDAEDGCEHEWDYEGTIHIGGIQKDGQPSQRSGRDFTAQNAVRDRTTGSFCQLCPAWRGSLGLEPSPELYVQHIVQIMREVRRVLRRDGMLWLNMGDSYSGSGVHSSGHANPGLSRAGERHADIPVPVPTGLKAKDLVGIPWRVAFALQQDGWWLRSDIIWSKPNPRPESVTDRPTKAHEYIFLLTKSQRYFFDQEAVREPPVSNARPNGLLKGSWNNHQNDLMLGQRQDSLGKNVVPVDGRNLRSVWTFPTHGFKNAHFAVFPEELAKRCIKAGTSEKGCCPECEAPWERLILHKNMEWTKGPKRMADTVKGRTRMGGTQNSPATNETLSWCRTCTHDLKSVSCTVLDPFAGTSTTGVVALKLARSFIGIELSEKYVAMSRERLQNASPLFSQEAGAQPYH